jgi:hypothetical protein
VEIFDLPVTASRDGTVIRRPASTASARRVSVERAAAERARRRSRLSSGRTPVTPDTARILDVLEDIYAPMERAPAADAPVTSGDTEELPDLTSALKRVEELKTERDLWMKRALEAEEKVRKLEGWS